MSVNSSASDFHYVKLNAAIDENPKHFFSSPSGISRKILLLDTCTVTMCDGGRRFCFFRFSWRMKMPILLVGPTEATV